MEDESRASTSQNGPSPNEAPALPVKRGEIGYDPSRELADERGPGDVDLSSGVEDVLGGGPHPAERSSTSTSPSPSTESLPTSSTPASIAKRNRTRTFFGTLRSSKPNKRFGGLSNATVLRIGSVILSGGGVVALWVFSIKVLSSSSAAQTSEDETGVTPSLVFVHVAFSLALLILLVFLERVIYQARVERFAFKNPGASALPRFRRGANGNESPSLPYAPWNRGPLPTYAAAMNVRGTGDVEDAEIAAPPPPAYGNTRGSTLLLAGISSLRESESGGTITEVPDSPPPPLDDDDRRSTRSGRRVLSWSESIRNMIIRSQSPEVIDADPEAQHPKPDEDDAGRPSKPEENANSSS